MRKFDVNYGDNKVKIEIFRFCINLDLIWTNIFKRNARSSNESYLKKTTIMIGVMMIAGIVSSMTLVTRSQISFAALSNIQNFMNMTEEQRIQAAQNMTQDEKRMVMNEFSKQNSTVYENMSDTTAPTDAKPLMGNFVDLGDGFHMVEGVAKVIDLADGITFLRLENLKATNGPDLYVYLSTGKDSSDIVNLGRL